MLTPSDSPARLLLPGPAGDRRLLRALAIVALLVGLGALLWMITGVFDRVHNTLVVILLAVLFAYLIYPPVKWLGNRGLPVPVATIVVYIVLGALVLGAVAWLTPAIAAQAEDLTHNFPHIVASVQRQIADPRDSPIIGRLPEPVRAQIAANAGKAGALVGGIAGTFGENALGILSGTTSFVIDLFLVLGVATLVLGELAGLQAFGIRLVPRRYRTGAVAFIDEVDAVIGGFVRGQVLLALGVDIAGTIVLLAVGVPYAILFGLLAGVVSIIPLVGPIVAILPVVLVAAFTVSLVKLIIVAVLYVVILVVQQNVVPLVVSRSVGVTPLVVFVALLLGSEAYGILGALLAIPIAGIIRAAIDRFFPPDPNAAATLIAARTRSNDPPGPTREAAADLV